jgi:signal transduction histidine kinase
MIFFEVLIYATSFYFFRVFVFQRDIGRLLKLSIVSVFLPLLVFAATEYNLNYFDYTNCDREAVEGGLWDYAYAIEGIFVLFILFTFISQATRLKRQGELRKSLLVASGIILFLIAFSWGNISGSITEDWSIGQYGLFGMPIFIGFLAYAIVKYQAMSIRVMAVQVLVSAIALLIGAQFFFVRSALNQTLTIITLFLVVIFGMMLIRSMKKEISRKEELQRISDSLAIANSELRRLDTAKSEFISIASHQLRTPLTAIKGFVSLLLEGAYGRLEPSVSDTLNKVYLANNRLMNLVENLLNISRIEAGRIQYQFAPAHIEDILTELRDVFVLAAHAKGLKLGITLPKDPLPMLQIDSAKIREAISNIIDNSIKYTEKGEVAVKAEKAGDRVVVTVSDTGVGVDADDLPHLFKKFERGKDAAKVNVSSTGLGLYVGKSFIEAHGGTISVESAGRGEGTCFTISLPIGHPPLEKESEH